MVPRAKVRRVAAVTSLVLLFSLVFLVFIPSAQAVDHKISGHVYGAETGTPPIFNCYVQIEDGLGGYWQRYTDAGGYYEATLPAGTYLVQYFPYDNLHCRRYYPGTVDPPPSPNVDITGGDATADATLPVGGKISGTVTEDVTGQPINGCMVRATYQWLETVTDALGNYTLGGLDTGSHKVYFWPSDGHYMEWYNNKATEPAADPIAVTIGLTTPGINASLDGPRIVDCQPPSAFQGQTLNVAIIGSGTRFMVGDTAAFGAGVTQNSFTVIDDTHGTANVTLAPDAAPGKRDVDVTCAESAVIPMVQGFEVKQQQLTRPVLLGPATSADGNEHVWGSTSVGGATLSVYDGAVDPAHKIGETTTNAYGNYGLQLTGLALGDHSLYARANWGGRDSEVSEPLWVRVDPSVAVVTDVKVIVSGNTYPQNTNGIVTFSAHNNEVFHVQATFSGTPVNPTVTMQGKDFPLEEEDGHYEGDLGGWDWRNGHEPGGLTFGDGSGATHNEEIFNVTLIDPSGNVYDKDTGERIQGAKVTCEYINAGGQWAVWPANEYLQANPLYTDILGHYGWDTPSGQYRVRVEKDGYQTVTSPAVSVPPPVTDLDIAMQRTSPSSYRYYFAEGTTRAGFEEWISIQNPGDDVAKVNITYMLASGENVPQNLDVQPRSRATVSVNGAVGPEQDVSATVSSDRLIIAERPMYFDYRGKYTGGSDVIGTTTPRSTWYLAEGCTRDGFEEWISIQNPSDAAAQVEITYMLGSGENKTGNITIAPRSRSTVDVNLAVGPGQDVSARVQSTNGVPIIAERPMYFCYRGKWTGGHDVVAATEPMPEWYFAEGCTRAGFEEWISIQNPTITNANVVISYMLAGGENKTQAVVVPARSRYTVDVNLALGPDQDVSCSIASDMPIIAERPVYFDYRDKWDGGHDVVGCLCDKDVFFFAEGCTRGGFEEWISIQNPSDAAAQVEITYMLGSGENKVANLTVAPKSRSTVDVNLAVGAGQDVSAKVRSTNGVPIIVERPMYFDYGGKWTGGHDVVGF